MSNAVIEHQTIRGCLRSATNALETLDDEGRFYELMHQAESLVEEIYDWNEILLEYGIHEKEDDVQRGLALAEKMAHDRVDWELLAGMAWIGNDDTLFKKCMRRAESLAQTSRDWDSCADTWATYFPNKMEAVRCLKTAKQLGRADEVGMFLVVCVECGCKRMGVFAECPDCKFRPETDADLSEAFRLSELCTRWDELDQVSKNLIAANPHIKRVGPPEPSQSSFNPED